MIVRSDKATVTAASNFVRVVAIGVVAASTAIAACSAPADSGTTTAHPSGSTSSSGGGGGAAGGGSAAVPASGETTWSDGQVIDTPVVIGPSAKVTIAPGATVHVVDGITITVQGTLASAGGAPSKITGAGWQGIIVTEGGTLALDGVDLENAAVGIYVERGVTAARYDHGTITASSTPFQIEATGSLTTSHANVVGSKGTSRIRGSLTASYLDYDANGFDGITAESDDASITVSDSKLHGTGGASDMIVSYLGAGSIKVFHTLISKVHCAFHLERVTNLDVAYVTAESDAYGFMMHGSLATGTKTVKNSNFTANFEWGIHEEDDSINGPTTVSGSYFANNGLGDLHLHAATQITVTDPATATVAGAGPR